MPSSKNRPKFLIVAPKSMVNVPMNGYYSFMESHKWEEGAAKDPKDMTSS